MAAGLFTYHRSPLPNESSQGSQAASNVKHPAVDYDPA